MSRGGLAAALVLAVAGAACSHSEPQILQAFSQVTRVYDPAAAAWEPRLSVFVQAGNADGTRQFDRLHLIQDRQNLWFPLTPDNWTAVERPGEYWLGANGLRMPPGDSPTGDWRVELVTRTGLKAEAVIAVPPVPPDAPAARTGPVEVADAGPLQYRVTGWPEDYLVWSRDAQGALIGRTKNVGAVFPVPAGTVTFQLYSYDKNRGEGLEAGPFSVKPPGVPADR